MAEKRNKMLTMWVTEDEHRRLLERCEGKQLEQAGAEFERSAAPIVARLNGIEAHREQERAAQHQKALELERSQRQKGFELGM